MIHSVLVNRTYPSNLRLAWEALSLMRIYVFLSPPQQPKGERFSRWRSAVETGVPGPVHPVVRSNDRNPPVVTVATQEVSHDIEYGACSVRSIALLCQFALGVLFNMCSKSLMNSSHAPFENSNFRSGIPTRITAESSRFLNALCVAFVDNLMRCEDKSSS